MRKLVITENIVGEHAQYVVETSAGVRAVGASLEGALAKLALGDGPPVLPDELVGLHRIFKSIRHSNGRAQISQGQEGA